jgi:hypothetical protein
VYWAVIAPAREGGPHDVELTGGVRQALWAWGCEVSWEVAGSWRWERDWVRSEPNLSARLDLVVPLGRRGPGGGG